MKLLPAYHGGSTSTRAPITVAVLLMGFMVSGCVSWMGGRAGTAIPARSQSSAPTRIPAIAAKPIGSCLIHVRIAQNLSGISFVSHEEIEFSNPSSGRSLPPDRWKLKISAGSPGRQRFHVFVKTFKPAERTQAETYVSSWRGQGYSPRIIALGRRFHTAAGMELDNRILWISLAQFDTREEAARLRTRLRGEGQEGWVHAELVEHGSATLDLVNASGEVVGKISTPIRIRSSAPILLLVEPPSASGKGLGCTGCLEVRTGPTGLIEVHEELPLENYLAGVLPAEMPARWPQEALKAQAIAARSETLANLGLKHALEGFDFCSLEHCRAYGGQGGRHAGTDLAVTATENQVLTDGRRVIPAVFSANCGGWTENNENVWAAPPDPALRAVADFPPGRILVAPDGSPPALNQWLRTAPPAYCSADPAYFRWTRRYSMEELSRIVNEKHPVGTIRDLELGERGASGRLKWIRVIGTKDSALIRSELAIRLALGGLPSAMFTIEMVRGERGSTVIFTGGGHGHGVGLCQHGARGMALSGASCQDILTHYFRGMRIVSLGAMVEPR
jgi:SpoIID/LytB domain protein